MQKTLQDLHISHERNEDENIPILVEERWDAFPGIPKLRCLSILGIFTWGPLGIPKLELFPLFILLTLVTPRSSNTSSTQNFNKNFSGGVSECGNEIPSCTAVTLLYNYKQTLPTVCYHNSMAPSQGGLDKNSNIRK